MAPSPGAGRRWYWAPLQDQPLPGVIRQLHQLGSWAEVISHFELWLAIKLGVPGERIIYNGPGKTREHPPRRGPPARPHQPRQCLRGGSGRAEARALGRVQKVGIRVVTSVGWSGQFGNSIAAGEALAMARRIAASDALTLAGLHIHLGTGLKHLPTYLQAIREVCVFAQTLRPNSVPTLSYLDFGGGFGCQRSGQWTSGTSACRQTATRPGRSTRAPTPPEAFAEAVTGLLREFYDPGHPENCPA